MLGVEHRDADPEPDAVVVKRLILRVCRNRLELFRAVRRQIEPFPAPGGARPGSRG